MTTETWVSIPNYSLYEINHNGDVRTTAGVTLKLYTPTDISATDPEDGSEDFYCMTSDHNCTSNIYKSELIQNVFASINSD